MHERRTVTRAIALRAPAALRSPTAQPPLTQQPVAGRGGYLVQVMPVAKALIDHVQEAGDGSPRQNSRHFALLMPPRCAFTVTLQKICGPRYYAIRPQFHFGPGVTVGSAAPRLVKPHAKETLNVSNSCNQVNYTYYRLPAMDEARQSLHPSIWPQGHACGIYRSMF